MTESQTTESQTIGDRLQNIPLWLFFSLIILSMAYISITPLGIPLPISDMTRACWEQVETLEEGDIMLWDTQFSAGTIAIHEPGFVVMFRHAMSKGVKIIVHSHSNAAPMLFARHLEKIKPEDYGYEYGIDYVHLGYIAGGETAAAAVLTDIFSVFSVDLYGTPLDELPLMAEVTAPTHEKIAMIFEMSSSVDNTDGWIRQAGVRYGLPFIAQPIGKDVPNFLPFYPLNLKGIMPGGIGAAEYEAITGYAGDAVKLSDMLTMGGGVTVIFIILGNIGHFLNLRQKKEEQ